MKTVCPNCYQKFDIPDEYYQQEIMCEKCHSPFFVTKAKFCPECGKANPAQAFACKQCEKGFFLPKVTEERHEAEVPCCPKHRISFVENLSGWDKLGINWCIIVGALSSACTVMAVIMILAGGIPDLTGYVLAVGMIFVGIIGAHGAYLLTIAKNPNKKIYWTPYRKFILTTFTLLCFLFGGGVCIVTVIKGTAMGLFLTIPVTLLGCRGIIVGKKLFNIRAEEDIDYEQDVESLKEERLGLLVKAADCCGFGGLFPLVGIVFCLASLVLIIAYKMKGGTNYIKTVILVGLGVVINIVTLYFMRGESLKDLLPFLP